MMIIIIKNILKIFILPVILGTILIGSIFYLTTGSYKQQPTSIQEYIEYPVYYNRKFSPKDTTNEVYTEEDIILSTY